ncbi:Bax inhibitor-1/YccA family protein [Candidatus Peregrinibacteria bacterium]|nr:MAG: Bax inhibitor-1/YccA family protein [Candidatus Peregrinibacteria bacterium]
MQLDSVQTHGGSDVRVNEFFYKAYGWMALALAISGAAAWTVANNESLIVAFIGNPILFYGSIIAELGLVFYLSSRIQKLSLGAALGMFLAYSLLNGMTLSVILLAYTAASIARVFFITAGTFSAVSLAGFVTKRDLSGMGGFLMMSLIGIIIASVVNIFLNSYMIEWIVSYAGVAIFVGLTAYDTQKLKYFASSNQTADAFGKMAVLGALTLYLDFINLFLFLLRIMGNRR